MLLVACFFSSIGLQNCYVISCLFVFHPLGYKIVMLLVVCFFSSIHWGGGLGGDFGTIS
jgi:hypothetical protein